MEKAKYDVAVIKGKLEILNYGFFETCIDKMKEFGIHVKLGDMIEVETSGATYRIQSYDIDNEPMAMAALMNFVEVMNND